MFLGLFWLLFFFLLQFLVIDKNAVAANAGRGGPPATPDPRLLLHAATGSGTGGRGQGGDKGPLNPPGAHRVPDAHVQVEPRALPRPCPARGAQNPLGPCPALPGGSLGARGVPGTLGHHSVCVHLSPDHTHDLLLDFGVLSIDIGISHLAIFVPARGEGGQGDPWGSRRCRRVGANGLTQRRSVCRRGQRRGRPRCCRVSAGPWR